MATTTVAWETIYLGMYIPTTNHLMPNMRTEPCLNWTPPPPPPPIIYSSIYMHVGVPCGSLGGPGLTSFAAKIYTSTHGGLYTLPAQHADGTCHNWTPDPTQWMVPDGPLDDSVFFDVRKIYFFGHFFWPPDLGYMILIGISQNIIADLKGVSIIVLSIYICHL